MKKMLQRGFTLIELLVVIAIIGILAAVVLASLNDARTSGSDAAIKQSLGNARSQAEIVYNRGGAFTYASVCGDSQIITLVDAARQTAGLATAYTAADTTVSSATKATCHNSATAWAIAVPLASNSASSWCVDSTGVAKLASSSAAISAVSGSVGFNCN